MTWTRRAVLAGGGAAVVAAAGVGVAEGVLPGRTFARRHLGLDGPDGVVPSVTPDPRITGAVASKARGGRNVGWTIAWPPGARKGDPLPVAVVLHGRRNDHATAFSRYGLGLDRFLAQAVNDGAAPFAMASVDGGDGYWHRRADGDDPGGMVIREFIPFLGGAYGLDVSRVALLGWSMGGYGALHLGGRLGRDRVRAVGAMSPALWHRYADAAPDSFDDVADFLDNTAFGRQRQLDGVRVRVDCGRDDPFYAALRDYVLGFATRPAGGFERGAHDMGYWRRMAPAHVRFVADALAT